MRDDQAADEELMVEIYQREVKRVDRRYRLQLLWIHVEAFVQAHLIMFGLTGALWLLYQLLLK